MISVSGLDGLEPSIIMCKFSKTLGIVNKESLICGWNIIKKHLKKYKTILFQLTLNIILFFLY